METNRSTENVLWATFVGICIALLIGGATWLVSMTVFTLFLILVLTFLIYSAFLLFLIRYNPLKTQIVQRKEISEVQINPAIVQALNREEALPMSEEKKKKKLKYAFLGSTIRKVYHVRGCRLAKLIKKRYLEQSNQLSFFKSRRFVPCKMCAVRAK